MVFKILILIGLVLLLRNTRNAILCAGIYAALAFGLTFLFSGNLAGSLFTGVVGGLLSFVYFSLLNKLEAGILWWVVLLGGFAIGIV